MAQAAANEISGAQLNALPEFDGKGDVEAWVRVIDNARTQFNLNQNATRAAAIFKLSGDASRWYRGRQLCGVEYTHWDSDDANAVNLRPALLTRFGPDVNAIAATNAVANLKQGANESIDQFHDRVLLAMDKKNHTYTAAQKAAAAYQQHFQADAFTFFCAGIHESIRQEIMGAVNPPQTLDDARVAARRVEVEMQKKKGTFEMAELSNVLPKLPAEDANQQRPSAPEKSVPQGFQIPS